MMMGMVLVVDDEPDLVTTLERLLQGLGHTCLHAHTAPDAIARIDREGPDLVVTDLRLPGTGGLAVARHARRHIPPIPVILITGYDSAQARTAARESGVDAYLSKPFSNAAFLDAVQRVLDPGLSGGAADRKPTRRPAPHT
jgi:two-component system nitrogen regulation response regulator GlnG